MLLRNFLPLASLSLVTNIKEKKHSKKLKLATEKASQLIKIFRAKSGIPGIAVQININGKYKLSFAYGYSDVENLQRCRPDSLMRIASISKSLTSIIAAKLVEEGLLDLDADITRYVPEFPVKTVGNEKVFVTSRQLLSHRSGIRHYKKSENTKESALEFLSTRHCCNSDESVSVFMQDPLTFKPGSSYLYTTFGFVLLGLVLERAAKANPDFKIESKDVLVAMFNRLFAELGLDNTHCEQNQTLMRYRSRQYCRLADGKKTSCCGLEVAPYVDNSCKWSGGGIVSTCDNLNRVGENLSAVWCGTGDGVVTRDTLIQFWTDQDPLGERRKMGKTEYGLGWMLKPEGDRLLIGHTGGACGGTTCMLMNLPTVPDKKPQYSVVTVLCNLENVQGSIYQLAAELTKLFN